MGLYREAHKLHNHKNPEPETVKSETPYPVRELRGPQRVGISPGSTKPMQSLYHSYICLPSLHFTYCKLYLSRRSSCDVNPCMLSYSHALWTIPAIAGDYLDDGAVDDYGDKVMILAVMMVI